jgi:hypothetical protein
MATFCLITGHDCFVAYSHRLLIYPSPVCVLCSEQNSLTNKDHLKKCIVLNTENNIVKTYRDARRRIEFLQVPEHIRYHYYYIMVLL